MNSVVCNARSHDHGLLSRVYIIFIDCTYSHFEHNSECPTCGKPLSENDFTELVVSDANNSMSDIAKTSMQALFSKQSKSGKALPFADLCFSMMRQIDSVKVSTKFLLKQLLMDSNNQSRKSQVVLRQNEHLKNEMTQLKQQQHSQRLQMEQANQELRFRLQARENKIAELQKVLKEKDQMLDQFRQMHGNMSVAGSEKENGGRGPLVMSSSGGRIGTDGLGNGMRPPQDPPLRGLLAQKAAQHQALQTHRQAPMPMMGQGNGPRRSSMDANGQYPRGQQHNLPPMMGRPFSGNSTGSSPIPGTPRIRELSSGAGYNFTSTAGVQRHMNKRRRGNTPGSSGGGSLHRGMSPNTTFTLNQGPHNVPGGQRWRR